MVSSDFGKLEVRRHLTSGDDCAMAGEATAVAAAPAAETFKKSRRFISSLSLGRDVSRKFRRALRPAAHFTRPAALWPGRISTDATGRKRDKGMTALLDQSRRAASGSSDNALKLLANFGANRAVDRRVRTVRLAVDDGRAGVGGGANRHVQRYFAEEWNSELFSLVPGAAMAENIGARAAMRALEIAHVLDNAEHGHVD